MAPKYPYLLVLTALCILLTLRNLLLNHGIWQCWGYLTSIIRLWKSVSSILLVTFSAYMLWWSKLPCWKRSCHKELREASGGAEVQSNILQGTESSPQPHELWSGCFLTGDSQPWPTPWLQPCGETLKQRTQLSHTRLLTLRNQEVINACSFKLLSLGA